MRRDKVTRSMKSAIVDVKSREDDGEMHVRFGPVVNEQHHTNNTTVR